MQKQILQWLKTGGCSLLPAHFFIPDVDRESPVSPPVAGHKSITVQINYSYFSFYT
jgi:hypothetical protein